MFEPITSFSTRYFNPTLKLIRYVPEPIIPIIKAMFMRTSVYPRERWSKLKPYLYIYIHRWNCFHQTREYFALFPFSHTFLDRINLRMGWMCAVQKWNVGSKEYRKRRIQNESKRDGQSIREKVYANFGTEISDVEIREFDFPSKKYVRMLDTGKFTRASVIRYGRMDYLCRRILQLESRRSRSTLYRSAYPRTRVRIRPDRNASPCRSTVLRR